VGLSFFMVNFSHLLLTHFRQAIPECSLLDLKAHFLARRYAHEALKLLPDGAIPSPFREGREARFVGE
jgi:putative transposase